MATTTPIPTVTAPAAPLRRAADFLARPGVGALPIEAGAFGRVALLWAGGRLLNVAILYAWFQISQTGRWSFGPDGFRPGSFLNFLTGWDADRYGTIAEYGYPLILPRDDAGVVEPNNWAFLPVFPGLVRAGTLATGLDWRLVSVLLALAAGLAATWFLYVLLRRVTTPEAAWWATAAFTVAPTSFILLVGYSEGLFMALTFGALILVLRRRYAWVIPLGVVAAFTRPGALALALTLVLVLAARWVRRDADPFPMRERMLLGTAAVATGIAGAAWPFIADAATGVPHAYLRTEMGWWVDYVGSAPFVPFTPWFRLAGAGLGVVGILLVVAVVVGFVLFLRTKGMRHLGSVTWAYVLSYGLYLLAVFLPQQSTFRILMPLAPALAHPVLVGTRRRRIAVFSVFVALQPVAALLLWTIGNP